MSTLLDFVIQVSYECGSILMRYFERNHIEFSCKSSPQDLLTQADLESDNHIRVCITKEYPDSGIITEEGNVILPRVQNGSEIWFCADPLDGTANFASNNPHFCVSIAVLDCNYQPLCGCVYNPALDELFFSSKGNGAFIKRKGHVQKMRESVRKPLKECLFATVLLSKYSKYYISEIDTVSPLIREFRETGSSCLDLCYCASGRFDGYWAYGPKIWDVAAAWSMINEVGLKIGHYDGKSFSKDSLNQKCLSIVCTSHNHFPEIIKATCLLRFDSD